MKTFDQFKRELLANPETRAEYDALAAEFKAARERIVARTDTTGPNDANDLTSA